VLVPPPDEQAAIVRFLDWATGRLERAIRAKRKVIALLGEQKQAIIHRAVTRGLDPSVPLKPSGIPWLGDIPQHWDVRRLRTLVHHIDQGVSPIAVGFLAEGDSWGVLKSGCVNRGVFRETEHKQLARGFEIDPAIIVKIGDVLISRACGSPTLVGSVGRVKSLRYKLILSDKTFRARFRDRVDVDFMVFAMNCRYYRHQVEQAISGAEGMANNLPLSSLRDFIFAIPPADEGAVIAGYLENETAGLQSTVVRLEREIDLLREYRTRLVADVVTGKLDVREAAARLPDEDPLRDFASSREPDPALADEIDSEVEGIDA
jgi:type I restriction enzyme S subunit